MPKVELVGQRTPYRGRNSYRDRTIGVPGQFYQAKNIRGDSGIPALRSGIEALNGTAPSAGVFRGGWVGTVKSYNAYSYSSTAIAAMEESGEIRLYKSELAGTWQAWAEITAASGKYGDTRVTAGDHQTFEVVPNEFGSSALITQTGEGTPLRIDLSTPGATSNIVTRIENITKPPLGQVEPVAGFSAQMDLADTVTAAETGTGFAAVSGGTNPVWIFTLTSGAVTAAETGEIYAGTSDDISVAGGKQLMIVASYVQGYPGWWENFKVEAVYGAGPSYVTVFDPTGTRNEIVRVPVKTTGERYGQTELIAFPIDDLAATIGADFRGLRLTAMKSFTAAGQSLNIFAIGVGGHVPALAGYCVAFENGGAVASGYLGSKTESPGVVLPPMRGKHISYSYTSSLPQSFDLPLDERLFYQVTVPAIAPTSTDGGRGVNFFNIYRQDPFSPDYYFASRTEVVSYVASTWGTVNATFGSTTAWGVRTTINDTVDGGDLDTTRVAPDAFNEAVPQGLAMAWANRRLYVGTQSSGSGPSGSLMVSDEENPYRHRRIAVFEGGLPDLSRGVEHRLDERVTKLIASSPSSLGQSRIYVWTSKTINALDGFQMRRLSSSGCVSPYSVCEWDGIIAYLDADRAVRVLSTSIENISRYKIDPDLLAMVAGRHGNVAAAIYRDRLHVAHTGASGAVNDKVEVYNFGMGEWESQDEYPAGKMPAQFCVWNTLDSVILTFFTAEGKLYRCENSSLTQDDGAQIPFELATSYFSNPAMTEKVVVGTSGVVCDDKTGETLTVTRVPMAPTLETGVTAAGVIDIDSAVGESYTWRVDKEATSEGPVAVAGNAVAASLTGTLAGSFKIYGWNIDVDGMRGYGEGV